MKEQVPLVSIVCTNFNKGEWIRDAIESFLKQQTNFDFEILLIDDASTDESTDIIRQYAKDRPDFIRAFFNKRNLGITKTWVKICKQARGKYIARCDGDDFWIDDRKLQKQVELLEEAKDSLWCSTDYDIITPEGKVTHTLAFESGLVDRADSYAKMLVTKGFTMSSTWLVDADLMREINAGLDSAAVDDTFNIQLDLFNKTKLTYLPEATVVYRINEGSDSRPVDMDKIRSRSERLLKTQLEYVNKYKDVDYGEMLDVLLRRDMQMELWATERLQIIRQQELHTKRQEDIIKDLQGKLQTITRSRLYRIASLCNKVVRKCIGLPPRVVRKILWLDGRRRYSRYHKKQYLLSQDQLKYQSEATKEFAYQPLISIIVPTYNTDPEFFKAMLDSVEEQTYPNWELIIIDDASPNNDIRKIIKKAAENNSKITYKFLQKNKHIAGATNEGFGMAKGEFVSLLDHDDMLHPSALFEIVKLINNNPSADFIYTDEDKIDEDGRHIDPLLKPDWNQELLYSVNYITHFTTIRKSVIDAIGGERSECNGAQDWDLFIRATSFINPENIHHVPKVLYSWRIHDASTAKDLEAKPYVFDAQRKLLVDHFISRGLADDEFEIDKNKYMNGAWDVSYKGQRQKLLHKSGEVVDYSRIKGLAMSEQEIHQRLGRVSHTANVYKSCQYSTDKNVTRRDDA